MTPWEALCVDLIGLYTLNGKDGSSIDPMCLTMIDYVDKIVAAYDKVSSELDDGFTLVFKKGNRSKSSAQSTPAGRSLTTFCRLW